MRRHVAGPHAQIYAMMDGDSDREAGDFGFDPLKLLPGNEEQYKLAELTHGRAGMLAFSAVITQSALPGNISPCQPPSLAALSDTENLGAEPLDVRVACWLAS